jgi:hypothetical protein
VVKLMPIRPENRGRYPTNWKDIRAAILERAANCCEGSPAYPDCRARNREPHPVTGSMVVLTVAHLDHEPERSDLEDLRAWCQRCHNTYDAAHRQETRRRGRGASDVNEIVGYDTIPGGQRFPRFSGPCKGCGAVNYALSTNGPDYCPACACGVAPEASQAKREVVRLREALGRIAEWSRAYPLDVFPEPTEEYYAKAAQVLEANGMTLDRLSAAAMRHVIVEVGKIAEDALEAGS